MRVHLLLLVALRAIRRNTMRSVLTAFGIVIGVAAVIVTVSIGAGARGEVEEQVSRLGQNVILVFPGSQTLGGASVSGAAPATR